MTSGTDVDITEALEWPDCREGEEPIPPSDELLWRQVHPNHIDEGVIDDVAFAEVVDVQAMAGTEAARLEVSTSRSAGPLNVTAEQAYEEWIAKDGRSAGTYAVSVLEVHKSGGRAIDDSVVVPDVSDHAFIDLRGFVASKKSRQRKARSMLAYAATVRARQHP